MPNEISNHGAHCKIDPYKLLILNYFFNFIFQSINMLFSFFYSFLEKVQKRKPKWLWLKTKQNINNNKKLIQSELLGNCKFNLMFCMHDLINWLHIVI